MTAKTISRMLSVVLLGLATPAFGQNLSSGRLIDLTHPFNEKAVYWPTAETFKKTEAFHGHTPGGWFDTAYNFAAAEHGGTHMDAPIHFAKGAHTADKVPLSRLIGSGIVIDVTRPAVANADYLVSPDDIEGFEEVNGRIPTGAIVLLNTGRAKYMGTAELGKAAVAKLHFPGLSKEGAALLVKRGIAAVGLDTPSIDYGQSKDFAAHVELMSNNIPAFENLADMSALPATGSTIIALPMKIEGGSGGPL